MNRHKASCNTSPRFERCAIAVRFLLLFALTCLISILSVKYTEFEQNFDVFSNYLESFNCDGFFEFINNYISTSKFSFLILIISSLSALTFFCSATLHIISVFSGLTYGMCIGIGIYSSYATPLTVFVYLFYIVSFSVIFAIAASSFLNLNRYILLNQRNTPTPKPYISPIFTTLLSKTARIFLIYALLHMLFSIAMFLISANN
jgi:hypothetical protein